MIVFSLMLIEQVTCIGAQVVGVYCHTFKSKIIRSGSLRPGVVKSAN